MNKQNWILELGNYQGRLLQSQDELVLQELCQACSDYFEITSTVPAGAVAAKNILTALPENKGYEDKLIVGIFDKSTDILVGVLDFIKHYPIQGVGMLGLLLLHPQHRSRGLGGQIYRTLENWWASQNGHTMRIGVVEQNQAALIFWHQLGFELVERKFPYKIGNLDSVLLVMECKTVDSTPSAAST
jgi:GNAT superfamily N-acetyltransferase